MNLFRLWRAKIQFRKMECSMFFILIRRLIFTPIDSCLSNAKKEHLNRTCDDCASEVKRWRRRRQNMKNSTRFKRSLKMGVERLEMKRNRFQQTNIRLNSENYSLKRQREILRQKLRSWRHLLRAINWLTVHSKYIEK